MGDVPLVRVVAANGRLEDRVDLVRRPAVVERLADVAGALVSRASDRTAATPPLVERLSRLSSGGVDVPLFRLPARCRRFRQLNGLLEEPSRSLERISGREPIVDGFQPIEDRIG